MKFIHVHYNLIQPGWKVLQVGGAAQPFRRADFVISPNLYEEKQSFNAWMQTYPEKFSSKTWVTQDLAQVPWPFKNNQFDYVVVGDDLIKTRDPVAVCNEIQRVGKRGYIEVPSVVVEHLRNAEIENLTGYTTHRWFADLHEEKLRFVVKHPIIHSKKDFWIDNPHISHSPYINPNHAVLGLFWERSFEVYEELEFADFPDWFFEENIWKHRNLTDTEEKRIKFWKIDEPVAMELRGSPFIKKTLVPISEVPVEFATPMLTSQNGRHPEILELEQTWGKKLKNKHDT